MSSAPWSVRPLAAALALGVLSAPHVLHAQDARPGSILVGVVVDGSSGTPVPGAFLSLGERGPRAIADSLGAFRLSGVAPGEQTLVVQRFGYRNLEIDLIVTDPHAPLRLVLSPDPVALDGLTVTGGASVTLTGVVVDQSTGAPIPWVSLVLSRDAVRPTERASSDPQGVFRMGEVPTGGYFLRVEAIGYESQYALIDVTVPPEPIELRLRPDSAVQAGLARFDSRLRSRRNYATGINYGYGQDRLHYTAAPSVTRFLDKETSIFLISCSAAPAGGGRAPIGKHCIVGRNGRIVEPRVYIDELPIMAGLDVLESYAPSELYLIEVFCGGRVIHAYTYPFIERMARRPRALLPTC